MAEPWNSDAVAPPSAAHRRLSPVDTLARPAYDQPPMRRHHSLLLIDHDPRRLSAQKIFLETHGFRVQGAATPAEGWEFLHQRNFAMVILSARYELENRGNLQLWIQRQAPEVSVLARERSEPEMAQKSRGKAAPELSPAELLAAIRAAFLRRRAPRRAVARAAAARAAG